MEDGLKRVEAKLLTCTSGQPKLLAVIVDSVGEQRFIDFADSEASRIN
jgi:hypothetical protein